VQQRNGLIDKVNQNVVSFYFINILHDISYGALRQGFEVCGIMEDVDLARKRNVSGGAFGFVRYGKVKDVAKLLKALNNVWFGDWKVVAKVASFVRPGNIRGDERDCGEGEKIKEGDKNLEGEKREAGKGKVDEGVNVCGGRKGNEGVVGKEVVVVTGVGGEVMGVENGRNGLETEGMEVGVKEVEKVAKVFIPKYYSTEQDVVWASRGMLATVLNGEVVLVLQRRIFYAGFEKLDIIPMGADKVLLRIEDDSDVNMMLSEASKFFDNFFSKLVKWNKDVVVRKRGAWVRIYGVLLQAWNSDFFLKLCVYDCGRLLKVDDSTLEKICFDYARVLVSTSSLDLINTGAKVMVEGVIVYFKIVEEGGFSLGEDACLSDDDVNNEEEEMGNEGNHDELNATGDVENLLNHLYEEWKKEQLDAHDIQAAACQEHPKGMACTAVVSLEDSLVSTEVPVLKQSTQAKGTTQQISGNVSIGVDGADTSKSRQSRSGEKKRVQRNSSCPPGRVHTVTAGPWSLKWANRHKDVVVGDASQTVSNGNKKSNLGSNRVTRKKGSGYLRHCAQNLKRIARLSDEDRKQVLRALHKTHRRRKVVQGASFDKVISNDTSSVNGSQSSVNNDWTNWLVLHGCGKALSDDVRGMGKVVGLKFKGDTNNMFDVLLGAGRKNKEGDGNWK